MNIVRIIINPPCIVSIEGCSWITNQTQIGPKMVSSKKNKLTSAAVINLGAIVTKTKGIATQRTHIKGTIKISLSNNLKLSTKYNANNPTRSFPIRAAGTRFLSFADLTIIAPIAKPSAVIKPNKSPKKFPNFIES